MVLSVRNKVALPLAEVDAPIRIVTFQDNGTDIEHFALVINEAKIGETCKVRLHSECMTGDLFAVRLFENIRCLPLASRDCVDLKMTYIEFGFTFSLLAIFLEARDTDVGGPLALEKSDWLAMAMDHIAIWRKSFVYWYCSRRRQSGVRRRKRRTSHLHSRVPRGFLPRFGSGRQRLRQWCLPDRHT